MVADIVLVRHAMPQMCPEVPAERWNLGDASRAAARELARLLPSQPFVLTSHEPKAWQTAEEILAVCGGTLRVDERVAETRRPHVWDIDFAVLAERYVGGEPHRDWEGHEAVVRRFDAAVREGLRSSHEKDLVVVNHGQALTLWLRSVQAIQDPPGFWSKLAFPDAWKVDVRTSGERLVAAAPVRLQALRPPAERE